MRELSTKFYREKPTATPAAKAATPCKSKEDGKTSPQKLRPQTPLFLSVACLQTSRPPPWNQRAPAMEPEGPRHGTSRPPPWNQQAHAMEPAGPRHGTSRPPPWNLQATTMEIYRKLAIQKTTTINIGKLNVEHI